MKITEKTTDELKGMQQAISGVILSTEAIEFIKDKKPFSMEISLKNAKMEGDNLKDDGLLLKIKAYKKSSVDGHSEEFERELLADDYCLRGDIRDFLDNSRKKFHQKAENIK